ncbi:MAG: hypothetical protein ACXWK9_09045 [Myxococcaceae bacterium]
MALTTMRGDPLPPVFWEVYAGMLRAIEEEKQRRRARGDDASVERFEREWAWIIDAEQHDPEFREQFEAERRIIWHAPGTWPAVGWWTRIAPPETRCIQAFLPGDDVDVARRAAPPRTDDDDTGRAVPAWTARGSKRGAGSAISVLGSITHYTFEEAWTREAHEVMVGHDGMGEAPQPAFSLTNGGMWRAIDAEKDRRHACGDHGSVERFERRRNTFFEANKPALPGEDDPSAGSDWQEEMRIVKAAPDAWPDAGYWTWIAPPQVRLFQAFLRGDPIDGDPVLADLPITHFAFEEMWTGEDQAAMHARNDDDAPFPPAYQRVQDGMDGAVFKETMRRRAAGDEASVDELDRERERIVEARKDPAFREQLRVQHQEVRRSCPHWGWWMWMQVPLVLLFQRFLRGEPIGAAAAAAPAAGGPRDAPAAAAAPPAGAAGGTAAAPEFIAHFPFEEGWTDDDHTAMSERDAGSVPFAHRRVLAGMELAILAEKRRRRAGGDMASVASFEQERTAVETRYGEDPAFQEECRAERITVLETTGRQWGWWIWQPVPVVRLIQGFLLGEPVGAADAPPPDGGAPPYPPVAPREQVTAAAAAELGLDSLSITHFPFEVPWTPADDDVIQATGGTGPRPPAWEATVQGLAEALAGEKARRRDAGDAVSVERFDLGYTRWSLESGRDPAFADECSNEAVLAAVYSGEGWGFWKYWPLVQVQGIQAFLRGEPVADAYVAGPAAPTPPVHLFPFEEPWSFEDDVYMTLHPEGPYPPAWDAVMQGSVAPIRAEKARREAARDTHSLLRFEAGLARSGREMADPGAMAAAEQERAAAAARGEDWTKSFWWWTPDVPLALLTIAFLRGEPLREPDAQGPTPAPAVAGVSQTAAAPQTDSPECWEPQWGRDEIAELRQWKRGGAPPEALMDTLSSLNAAVAREKERRRRTGDGASVERFEREMRTAGEEARSDEQAWQDVVFAALARREKVSFWACMPPRKAAISRRFLRGEDAESPHTDGA